MSIYPAEVLVDKFREDRDGEKESGENKGLDLLPFQCQVNLAHPGTGFIQGIISIIEENIFSCHIHDFFILLIHILDIENISRYF